MDLAFIHELPFFKVRSAKYLYTLYPLRNMNTLWLTLNTCPTKHSNKLLQILIACLCIFRIVDTAFEYYEEFHSIN